MRKLDFKEKMQTVKQNACSEFLQKDMSLLRSYKPKHPLLTKINACDHDVLYVLLDILSLEDIISNRGVKVVAVKPNNIEPILNVEAVANNTDVVNKVSPAVEAKEVMPVVKKKAKAKRRRVQKNKLE